jgi:hypothetical protein
VTVITLPIPSIARISGATLVHPDLKEVAKWFLATKDAQGTLKLWRATPVNEIPQVANAP